ncbi:MAG: helix-turn-helix domain-containing protein [Lachnospiraceae bacterium]|nr:helix-turn-helix domain-containing protein [Lachnospiraceae bacterium]
METSNAYMRELLTTSYDATIKEDQIQISADRLESYVRDMAQLLAGSQTKEDPSLKAYEEAYRGVFTPLYENKDFHELVEETAAFLERSVVIIDLGFHVIDYSRKIKVTDPLWSEYVKRGSCTYEFIKAINEMLPSDKLPRTSEAFFVSCPLSDEIKLCSLLYYKKHHIGYLILLDNKKGVQPYHQQFLPRISKKLSKSLRYHEQYDDLFISASTEILTNLLNGTPIDEGEETLLSKTLQLPCAIRLYIFRGRFSTLHDVSYIRNRIIEFDQPLHVFVYHNYIVAFVKAEEEEALREGILAADLYEQISDVSCSNVFHHIHEIPEQYRLARTTFSIVSKLGHKQKFYSWKEYEFYHILNECKDRGHLRSLIHPAVYTLMEYDETKDGRLLDTLKCFIACGCSGKDTAAALFVHRNTLAYRLKKISELTAIDLEDISEILRLDRSMKILEFLG